MEKDERERIRTNLHGLVTYTICDAELLSLCHERGVLSIADIDKIAAISEHLGKACEFYKLIQTKSDSYQVLKDSLLMTNQHGIVEILEKGIVPSDLEAAARVRRILYDGTSDRKRMRWEAPPTPVQPSDTTTIFDVGEPVPLFTGRKKELEELHRKVLRTAGTGHPTVISQLTSISGLGGIGKSQLGRKYVQEQRAHFEDNCVWLNAESELSLGESFRNVAKDRLGILTLNANGSEKKIQTVVGDVYRFFRDRKCLFIFDNAERAPWLKQFLPVTPPAPGQSRPYILLTSRTREWDKGIEVIDLDELEMDDAITLVKKGLGLEEDGSQDGSIRELVKRLQCFPLAIQQAISYIEDQQQMKDYTVGSYLEEFDKRQKELLAFNEMSNQLLNDYTMTTLTTWKITVEKLGKESKHGGVALKVLYAMAYLSPEGIKREMLLHLPGIPNEEELMGGVKLLLKHTMARGKDKQRILSIHRLVQEVTRLDLVASNQENSTLEGVLHMLSGTDGLMVPDEYLHHLPPAWEHAWKSSHLMETFSYLPAEITWFFYENGRDEEAIQFGEKALDALGPLLGEDHPDMVRINHCMAPSLVRCGKFELAFSKLHSVLEKRKLAYGLNDRKTLDSMNNLATLYFRQAKFEEALELFQTVHEMEKGLVPGSPNLDVGYWNVGVGLLRVGRLSEARQFLNEAYLRLKQGDNKAHPIGVATALGNCLFDMGDMKGAMEILEANYKDPATLSKDESANMCKLINTIGKILRKSGDYQGALLKHKQAFHEKVDIFGPDHLEAIMGSTEIAADMKEMGGVEDAILILEDALPKLEALLGDNHYHILEVNILLADAVAKKDMGRASQILEEQKAKLRENGWENSAFFKNRACKDIERIENNIAGLDLNKE